MSTVLETEKKVERTHDYPIYDCDHHYYETPDAFLRHLPKYALVDKAAAAESRRASVPGSVQASSRL